VDFDDLARAVQAFVTLLVIMDPLGNVPIFLSLTATDDHAKRRRTALHATMAATLLIYAFAFFGTQILASLSIGLPALQIAGGVMLFLTALEMLKGELETEQTDGRVNVAIVPLGTPLMAGPGAIAATMVLMTGGEGSGRIALVNQLPVIVGIAGTLAVSYLALRYSLFLERILKDNGIHLVTRVMGMLLLAIAVELVASGVLAYQPG
jgi:multiple antibiotic resistance protein